MISVIVIDNNFYYLQHYYSFSFLFISKFLNIQSNSCKHSTASPWISMKMTFMFVVFFLQLNVTFKVAIRFILFCLFLCFYLKYIFITQQNSTQCSHENWIRERNKSRHIQTKMLNKSVSLLIVFVYQKPRPQ